MTKVIWSSYGAENKRLRADLAKTEKAENTPWFGRFKAEQARATVLTGLLKRALEALEPMGFTAIKDECADEQPVLEFMSGGKLFFTFTCGDFRRARSVAQDIRTELEKKP